MTQPKYPWSLEFSKPVIPGFFPDPSAVRVGDDFYLVNSSFEYAPGVPVHHSKDLISWTQIGYALPTRRHLNVDGQGNSMGIFAPTIRHHKGKFYMITTSMDGQWQVLVTAENPAGPWSEPVRIDVFGIDPDLAWDENDNCLMTYASLPLNGIGQVVIDPESGQMLTEPKLVWQGTGGKFPEGPHLYNRDGFWYIVVAEGGTERGHSVAVGRSKNIDGPFEAAPNSPLLSNRGTAFTVQNTGHADLIERVDGSWAMVFHGTRPKGASPEWHILGRETCAVEVTWVDGWPQLGSAIEPEEIDDTVELLGANSQLPTDWIAPSSWPEELVSSSPEGLVFTGFVGRRQLRQNFDLQVRLSADQGTKKGVEVRIDNRHWLRLQSDGNIVQAIWHIGDHEFVLGQADSGDSAVLRLRSINVDGGFHAPVGPDRLIASLFDETGKEIELASIDGRYLSTEVAGGMTGRVIGVHSAGQPVTLNSWNLVQH